MGAEGQGEGTVSKALQVLDVVANAGKPIRFAELLSKSDFPKATLYRFIQTLTQQGMLAFDPERSTYTPGMRLVRLAHSAWSMSSLAPIARPFLDRLAADTGETLHLAQMDAGQVLYVDKRNAKMPVEMFAQAGKVGPAYCTGVGKAILAFLPQQQLDSALQRQSFLRHTPRTLVTVEALQDELADIRAVGHAFDREEHEQGIICCAAPILTRTGRVLGALSVTSTTTRMTLATLEAKAPDIKGIAAEIAKEAEKWRFPEQG